MKSDGPELGSGVKANKGAHLKATGSGKTTLRRRGPGTKSGEGISAEREVSRFRSPGTGMCVVSLGIEVVRLRLFGAANLAGLGSSSLWPRLSERESLNDMVIDFRQDRQDAIPSWATTNSKSRQTSSTGITTGACWRGDGWLNEQGGRQLALLYRSDIISF